MKSIWLKSEDCVALSCVLSPSGCWGELTKPSLHLLAEYCMYFLTGTAVSIAALTVGARNEEEEEGEEDEERRL